MSGDDALLELCRGLPGASEDVKWEKNLVFSVGEKMFCVFGLPEAQTLSFKVDPDAFDALVDRPGIRPAPYLAKYSWIFLESRDALPRELLEGSIERSHELVAARLPGKVRAALGLT